MPNMPYSTEMSCKPPASCTAYMPEVIAGAHHAVSHSALLGLVLALAATSLTILSNPAQAQTASSSAFIYNNATDGTVCQQVNNASPSTVSCSGTVAGATATSSASVDNAARTVSAAGALTQGSSSVSTYSSAAGLGKSYGALTVSGTPSSTDDLVFHFLTTQSATGSGGVFQADEGVWGLLLENTNSSDEASVDQFAFGDGTYTPLDTQNATQTADGFDLTLPFMPDGNTFSYFFEASAEGYFAGSQAGTTVTGTISATLASVDAVDANGVFISSASFDPTTGLGTIDASGQSTVPEPGSLALLGTGLLGLVPLIQRRR